ncbi:MAG TPA: stage V sporulation protein AB [Bacillota bacterium]|nr:stage V sporulation protein AB [Bacillota bacterium]
MLIFLQMLIGFSSGIAVGAGYVAFLTLLKIIPRLIFLSNRQHRAAIYIIPVISGTMFGTYLSFTNLSLFHSSTILLLFGIIHGIFNGMIAAALAEVLNVFPILTRRIGLDKHLKYLLMAIVFGKVFGSLFQWIILVKY